MGRSLWLDEAWVANSIQAPSLRGMFYYPGWLQTSPPLFLLLARAALRLLGPSNAAFRVVPLLLALAAAAGMLAVSRLLLRPSFAVLAAAVVIFDPTAIEYSHTLKPYSGELAVTGLLLLAAVRYLQQPDRRRYVWLLATIAVGMPLAYSAVSWYRASRSPSPSAALDREYGEAPCSPPSPAAFCWECIGSRSGRIFRPNCARFGLSTRIIA